LLEVRGPDWIGEDALARMERIGTRLRSWINRRRLRDSFCTRFWNFEQRQVLNRARPSELKVFQAFNFLRLERALRERHREKRHVPQKRGDDRSTRPARFDPAILEKAAAEKSCYTVAGKNSPDAAAHALVKITPSNVEARAFAARRKTRGDERHSGGCLTEEIECAIGMARRHRQNCNPVLRRWGAWALAGLDKLRRDGCSKVAGIVSRGQPASRLPRFDRAFVGDPYGRAAPCKPAGLFGREEG
jgi:hypothetical protein